MWLPVRRAPPRSVGATPTVSGSCRTLLQWVVDPLNELARGGIEDEPDAAGGICQEEVGGAAFDHTVGDVDSRPVDEAAHDGARAAQLGGRAEPITVKEALGEEAIHLLADPSVLAVDNILDLGATGRKGGTREGGRSVPAFLHNLTRPVEGDAPA